MRRLNIYMALVAIIIGLSLTACSDDDDNGTSNGLNSYESSLIGEWRQVTDDESEVWYAQLKNDHTGYQWYTYYGEVRERESIVWSATATIIYGIVGDTNAGLNYTLDGDILHLSGYGQAITYKRIN